MNWYRKQKAYVKISIALLTITAVNVMIGSFALCWPKNFWGWFIGVSISFAVLGIIGLLVAQNERDFE